MTYLAGLSILSSILTSILILLATYILWILTYGLLLCPTKHLPGQWHSRFTSLSSQVAMFSGRGAKSVDELHKKYGKTRDITNLLYPTGPNLTSLTIEGPIVRVSPSTVSVLGEEAVRVIYGGTRPYAKDARLADLFSMCRPEYPNVAGIQDASQAMKRRRIISTAFSTKFLSENESVFLEVATELLDKIEGAKSSGNDSIDMLHSYRECATSLIGDHSLKRRL